MTRQTPARRIALWPFVAAMAATVAASNVLVQYPFGHFGLQDLLTWGAFTYPVAFLVTDLSNRAFGPQKTRLVVLSGFVVAVILSIWLATPRIAIASGSAFLVAQLLDVSIFHRLRHGPWWHAPMFSSLFSSALDTAIFFSLAMAPAFAGIDAYFGMEDSSLAFPAPLLGIGQNVELWQSLALGDFLVKLVMAVLMLAPYKTVRDLVLRRLPTTA